MQHQFHLQSRSNLDRQVSVPFSKKGKGREAIPDSSLEIHSQRFVDRTLPIKPCFIRATGGNRKRHRGIRDGWWTKRRSSRFTSRFLDVMERDGQRRRCNKRNSKSLPRNKIQRPPVLHLFCTIAGKLRSWDCRESGENLEKGWSLI